MSGWINVTQIEDFPIGTRHIVDVEGVSVLVFNLDGNFFAIENVCTHDGGELGDGPLIGDEIVCPRHGAKFCIKTGAVTAPPAYEDVVTFPTRVHNNMVQVRDARWD